MSAEKNEGSSGLDRVERKRYMRYTREVRLQLIKLVDEDELPTAEAARILGIKQTSACRIMKSYHRYNRIFEKKSDRLRREAGSAPHPYLSKTDQKAQQMASIRQNWAHVEAGQKSVATTAPPLCSKSQVVVQMEREHKEQQNILVPPMMPMGSCFYPFLMWGVPFASML